MSFLAASRHLRQHFKRNSARLSSSLSSLPKNLPLDVHPEVQEALAHRRPVVALETTLVTHGFPHPVNFELAMDLENIVRSTGAIPATIGMIEGRVKIGLEPSELARLADTKKNTSIVKLSRRDVGPAVALKADGGTTCSATLMFAAMAGIKVFSTGGMGGVHRGAETTMDVSADLAELSRNPVGLVSAGVKSILDIGRTLEYLETLGVPVVSYSQTKDFPAFFTPKSGFKVAWNVNDPVSAAQILYTQAQFGMQNGTLIGVPIPEQYEKEGMKIQAAVDQAVEESEHNGIAKLGKEVTPWLLKRVSELTEGRSQTSNIALLKNTAYVGGQVAVEYEKLAQGTDENNVQPGPFLPMIQTSSSSVTPPVETESKSEQAAELESPKLVVIGCAAVDITAQETISELEARTTVPGIVTEPTLGGVSRNIAEAAFRLLPQKDSVMLLSPIAEDAWGGFLKQQTQRIGMRTDGLVVRPSSRTASCNMLLDSKGDLRFGIASMDIVQEFPPETAIQLLEQHRPSVVALDGNLSSDTISQVVRYCNSTDGIQVLFEPTSVVKSTRILQSLSGNVDETRPPVAFITPNLLELGHIYKEARESFDLFSRDVWWRTIDGLSLGTQWRNDLERLARSTLSHESSPTAGFLIQDGVAQMATHLLPFFRHLIIKCGSMGVVVVMRVSKESDWSQRATDIHERFIVAHGAKESVVLLHQPALPANVLNVTGAGDSFVGALLAQLTQKPGSFNDLRSMKHTLDIAQQAAVLTLASDSAVSSRLSELSII